MEGIFSSSNLLADCDGVTVCKLTVVTIIFIGGSSMTLRFTHYPRVPALGVAGVDFRFCAQLAAAQSSVATKLPPGVGGKTLTVVTMVSLSFIVLRNRPFSPNSKTCYGVFSPEQLQRDPVQLQHHVPEKVQEGSGAFRCRRPMKFWRFRCRWLMGFRRVSGQIGDKVPEGSGADG